MKKRGGLPREERRRRRRWRSEKPWRASDWREMGCCFLYPASGDGKLAPGVFTPHSPRAAPVHWGKAGY